MQAQLKGTMLIKGFGGTVLEGVSLALMPRRVAQRMTLPPAVDAWKQVGEDLAATLENHPVDEAVQISERPTDPSR